MKRTAVITLVVVAVLIATACKSKDKATSGSSPAAVKAQLAPGVVPGSYEDWCEVHHLPKSLDTQCNPDLIPAFKAAGDWCEEHNVPESQCTKCNSDIKFVRPPKKS